MRKKLKNEQGLTLIELIIVIAIGATITVVGFGAFQEAKSRKDLELSLNELASTVRNAREQSVTQEDGNRWSVRFNSSTTAADTYEIYTGADYSTTSLQNTYTFGRRAVEFSEPSNNRLIDLQFQPISGKVANNKIISITNERDTSRVGDLIVNTLGLITERLEDNVVGYWHLDEGTGTSTFDASGNGNSGDFVNTPTWQSANSCKSGDCLSFDAVDERINIPTPLEDFPADKITVMAWVQIPSHVDWYDYVRNNWAGNVGAWLLYSDSSGNARFGVINDSLTQNNALGCAANFTANAWHHLVGTYDGSVVRVYLDGAQCATTSSLLGQSLYTNGAIQIGEWGSVGASTHYIDEVRIYNTALSSSTIKSIYEDLR